MKIFEKMLKGKKEMNEISDERVPEELFVEKEAPTPEQVKIEPKEKELSLLDQFINEDYSLIAYRDGFNFHSNEMLCQKTNQIKAEFHVVLDKMICSINTEIYDLKIHLDSKIRGASAALEKKMEHTIDLKVHDRDLLNNEKSNCDSDKGIVMKQISSYKESYLKGMSDYYEQKEFAVSTGLFK